jgi:hypothetical protein
MQHGRSRRAFWLLRTTYPWGHIIWRTARMMRYQTSQHRVAWWFTVCQLDFATLLAWAIELTQPEFWLL